MANFPRVKPAGYAQGDPITPAEINQLDSDHAKSVNGDEGGTYAGAQVWNGAHTFNAAVGLNGAVTLGAAATVSINNGTQVTYQGTNLPKLANRLHTWPINIFGAITLLEEGANPWGTYISVTYGTAVWQMKVVGTRLMIPILKLPLGADITQIKAYIDGKGGGVTHAALPATLPSLLLRKRPLSTGVAATVGTVTDAPANLAAYEAYHALTLNIGDGVAPINGTDDYWLQLTGESGANSVVDSLALIALEMSFTCKQIAPG